ncbi:MAG: hypothetical protein H5U24_06515 [Thioclava marina]|jgi:hypothetical protein|uniref:Uncharacterized protein n=2 Tax=Thioclava TaxID=285107 RepID=A0A074JAE1_9RHOB|nr:MULTISPECIES: hypothetical protein [Thioclava]TNE93852.1 MAG: hypothetical protein EP337_02300 [Paracoccaceae bacterium]KEO52810.1 hypothetical protein TP2_07670 [Thioclava pacifica DSM 10166]MBC7145042.1 hypothetical protein [Thioclava marina]MBD3803297.1 hypothetical protein [Thioclava sp.]OOY13424.1 hypothetical protein BMG00_06520 [Thioclava marina]
MTMTTADTGAATYVADHHDTDAKEVSRGFMYTLALVILGLAAGMTAIMGLGGLILWAVGATWIMLAVLVVMTAGG